MAVNALERAKHWLKHSLAPTLSALIERVGKDEFYELIEIANPKARYKSKHLSILNSMSEEMEFTCLEMWDSLVPHQLADLPVAL